MEGAEVKACVFCKHCDYDPPYSYSTMTSGGGYFSCMKNVFSYESSGGSVDLYEKALDCQHFELRDELKAIAAKRQAK